MKNPNSKKETVQPPKGKQTAQSKIDKSELDNKQKRAATSTVPTKKKKNPNSEKEIIFSNMKIPTNREVEATKTESINEKDRSVLDADNRSQIKEFQEFSEKKYHKHLNAIDAQISNSDQILAMQENLFKKLSNLSKESTANDIKLEKFLVKADSEDYYSFLDKYSQSLDEMMSKLKGQLSEIDNIKVLKEENKSLQMKLDLADLEKKEFSITSNSKLESLKNYMIVEFNNFSDFILDLDNSYYLNKFSQKNIDESSISLYFQNLKQALRNVFKQKESLQKNANEEKLRPASKQLSNEASQVVSRLKDELDYYRRTNEQLELKLQSVLSKEALNNKAEYSGSTFKRTDDNFSVNEHLKRNKQEYNENSNMIPNITNNQATSYGNASYYQSAKNNYRVNDADNQNLYNYDYGGKDAHMLNPEPYQRLKDLKLSYNYSNYNPYGTENSNMVSMERCTNPFFNNQFKKNDGGGELSNEY